MSDQRPAWVQRFADLTSSVTAQQMSRFLPPDEGGRASAVLILLGEGALGPDLLLTQRAATLSSHAGQPAFPGGAVDEDDADAVAAALREAREETGLDPDGLEVLGSLPDLFLPPSGFVVTPVLAWWRTPSPVHAVDAAEVESVHRVPLSDLVNPSNRGRARHPSGYVGAAFAVEGMLVWGFTAGLIDRLLDLTGLSEPWDRERYFDLREVGSWTVLDIALIVLLVGVAIGGYRQGFVAGIFGFAGFFLGGAVGLFIVPKLLSGFEPGALPALIAVGGALVCAGLGQAMGSLLGASLRRHITWRPARAVDAGAGAVLSIVSMVILVWVLAYAIAQGPVSPLTDQVRSSKVLTAIDRVMPDAARGWFADFRATLARSSFPQVFSAIAPPAIVSVPAPDQADVDTAAVRRAALSSVEVVGDASSCDKRISGSGFFYAPHHVLTNAHVVAGTDDLSIRVGGAGASWPADVVAIDRQRDVAVLYVPSVSGTPLPLDTATPRSGDPSVVIGYPGGGPLTLRAARVRDVQEARGPDIDGSGLVTREILALRTVVQPGNSGGPLVDLGGEVDGVVFAASVTDPDTGYALTVREVSPVAAAGAGATAGVPTGSCALG